MTLRTRLLLVLVGVVALGLVVSGFVTYKSLESFLVSKLDQQLQSAVHPAESALARCVEENSSPFGGFALPSGHLSCTTDEPPVPSNTFAELRASAWTASTWFLPTGSTPSKPDVPADLAVSKVAASNLAGQSVFSAGSADGITYHAVAVDVAVPQALGGGPGLIVVAVPLTGVDQTLGRLLLIEVLVSAAVLLLLGTLAYWIVRRGLRPLDEMATTAGAIAAGDLTQRVPDEDERTEVGRLGQALNVMLEEIEEAFAARQASEERLRRFLADASHELRTPLTSIRGYAEMFDRGARDRPEDLAKSMHHIRNDADRMSTLVDDLLLLARLGRERPLANEQVDLRKVLEPAVAAIAVQSPDRQVTLRAPEAATVAGDGDRLRQVVDNLLVNALRHTPAGTPIEVGLRVDVGSALVSVTDHGPGIPASERSRIFEPFYRADPSRSRETGGQGLGLAIVATIVQAHGGDVGVDEAEGGGARFWVRLPVLSLNGAAKEAGEESGAEGSGPQSAQNDKAAKSRDTAPVGTTVPTVPVVSPSSAGSTSGRNPD